jgi:hypothetical protein
MFWRVMFNGRTPATVEVITLSDALPQQVVDTAWDALARYLGCRGALEALLSSEVEVSAFTEQDVEYLDCPSEYFEEFDDLFAECKTGGRYLVRTVYRLANKPAFEPTERNER